MDAAVNEEILDEGTYYNFFRVRVCSGSTEDARDFLQQVDIQELCLDDLPCVVKMEFGDRVVTESIIKLLSLRCRLLVLSIKDWINRKRQGGISINLVSHESTCWSIYTMNSRSKGYDTMSASAILHSNIARLVDYLCIEERGYERSKINTLRCNYPGSIEIWREILCSHDVNKHSKELLVHFMSWCIYKSGQKDKDMQNNLPGDLGMLCMVAVLMDKAPNMDTQFCELFTDLFVEHCCTDAISVVKYICGAREISRLYGKQEKFAELSSLIKSLIRNRGARYVEQCKVLTYICGLMYSGQLMTEYGCLPGPIEQRTDPFGPHPGISPHSVIPPDYDPLEMPSRMFHPTPAQHATPMFRPTRLLQIVPNISASQTSATDLMHGHM